MQKKENRKRNKNEKRIIKMVNGLVFDTYIDIKNITYMHIGPDCLQRQIEVESKNKCIYQLLLLAIKDGLDSNKQIEKSEFKYADFDGYELSKEEINKYYLLPYNDIVSLSKKSKDKLSKRYKK